MKARVAEAKPAENRENTSPDSVRRQLQRILASPGFARSERLGSFLRFVVEEALQGRLEQLKETVVGTEVYGKEEPASRSGVKPRPCLPCEIADTSAGTHPPIPY